MSKKSAGKRKKTDNESLSSVINEINTITSTECSKSRKTRPGRPAKSKATDIEFESEALDMPDQLDDTLNECFNSEQGTTSMYTKVVLCSSKQG